MSLFLSLSIALLAATVFAFAAKYLKQPLIVAYLFAGILLAYSGALSQSNQWSLETMASLGITFLLFLVGLEMNIKELPWVGKVAIITGAGQIVFTTILGYLLTSFLGFPPIESLYIAIALTFSSTIIVVKLLSEKKQLNSLYGKISVGFLLVQDFVAILILVLLSGFSLGEGISFIALIQVLSKAALLVGAIILLEKTLLPKIFDKAATSTELLFITSVAWALLVSSVVSLPQIGFSIEIGGFLAGLALANTSEHHQIAARVKPLRDFFITIFFLLLGAKLAFSLTTTLLVPALILSLFVLIGNPLIVMAIMGFMGYKKRTSFLASVTVAQISEFSFIIAAMGEKVGHIGSPIVGLITIVGVITMTTSSYLILHGEKVYVKIKHLLTIFERKKTKESAFIPQKIFSNHTVLIGSGRMGTRLIPILQKRPEALVVIDFNPKVVQKLSATPEIFSMYGDIGDPEALEILRLPQAKLIVSTISDREQDLVILDKVKFSKQRPTTIFVANNPQHALTLYEKGADYVLVPSFVSGDHLAHTLSGHGISKEYFQKLKDRDFTRFAKERLL